jgi:hypothetical protein
MKRTTINRIQRKREHRYEILRRVFSNFYGLKDMTLPKAIEILKPHRGEIAAELRYLNWYDQMRGWMPLDNRKGVDTYGYESEDSILINLQYISDRFPAQFRLQWVLDLLDKN